MAARRLLGFAVLMLGLTLAALAASAQAETGAPALEGDGVWRAHGDWALQAGDTVVHDGESIEVEGNLTLAANASLSISGSNLTFVGSGAPLRSILVGENATLRLVRVDFLAAGVADTIAVLQGTLYAENCSLRFAHSSAVETAIRVVDGAFDLQSSLLESAAALAVEANRSHFHTLDSDVRKPGGALANLSVGGEGSYLFDSTEWGTLWTEAQPAVTALSTVRFFLVNVTGRPLGGRVNGTGPFGEEFILTTEPPTPAVVRLKTLSTQYAPAEIKRALRVSPPLAFTALVSGEGGNTSEVRVDGPRYNITVLVERSYDLAVTSLTVYSGELEGPPLKRAYFLKLNESVSVLMRVENRGAAASPATNVSVKQFALDATSWAVLGVRDERRVAVRALQQGESENFSFSFVPGAYGEKLDSSRTCFVSVSYTSAVDVGLVRVGTGDYAAWNEERMFTVVAYDAHSDPSPECQPTGGSFLPWLALGGGAAIAAVAYMSYRFSDQQVARRAAARGEAARAKGERPKEPPRS